MAARSPIDARASNAVNSDDLVSISPYTAARQTIRQIDDQKPIGWDVREGAMTSPDARCDVVKLTP